MTLHALLIVDLPNVPFEKRQRFNAEMMDRGWFQHTTPQIWTKDFYPSFDAACEAIVDNVLDEDFVRDQGCVAATEHDVRRLCEEDVSEAATTHDVWTWRAFLQVAGLEVAVFDSKP